MEALEGFTVTHRMGSMESDPVGDWLDSLLIELDLVDDEHPDVAIVHESGWSLSAFRGGLVVWENVEVDQGNFRAKLTRPELREAFDAVARGDITAVELVLARDSQS